MRHAYRNADLKWHPAFAWMLGPTPPDDFVSDGASKAPDRLFGVDITPAAHWHDYDYSASGGLRCEVARLKADQRFLFNLTTCGLSPVIARVYYFRVRLWGHLHYRYTPWCEPDRTLGFWLGLLIGRYVSW